MHENKVRSFYSCTRIRQKGVSKEKDVSGLTWKTNIPQQQINHDDHAYERKVSVKGVRYAVRACQN